ncbi:MAG: Wzz/FepE/Etk N-terminal domain-containing protein [Lachnospiraceae bacterium]|nr:Wzz/FepE/Etk N-terminal domain-containing protein [Lachnospiraceae bacterium]
MKERENGYYEIDLWHILKVLWEKIWLLILATVVAGGCAFSYTYFLVKPQYQSSALFYVNNSSFSIRDAQLSINSSELSAAKSLVDTYIVILKSRTTLEDVIKKANVSYTYNELSGMIEASAVNNTEVFSVSVKSTNPKEAETLANVICLVLPRTISNVVDGSDVRIVDYAVVPEKRVSPSYTKNTAIGALIGLLICALLIVIADMLDDIIHNSAELAQEYDIPILAVIPNLKDRKIGGYGSRYYRKGYYEYYYRSDRKPDSAESSDTAETKKVIKPVEAASGDVSRPVEAASGEVSKPVEAASGDVSADKDTETKGEK